ncbi:hypothetical protein E8E13_005353 [Curvularia kusanoi]|uniref:Uncharacterized protein n=1 Tax=Curvularia kusanoi TaxID=90978 RepID=A0A9P4T992_CURKU|nr:hypothetical protein E8E13_005353 [Curvularia kusanoi]
MSTSKRGFLDLPAEIRNEIYEVLVESVDTNVGPKTIRLRPRNEFSSTWKRKNPHRGEVYALNQVCRTTRHEFGPLYVSEISHRIRVSETLLPQFLDDFFLSDEAQNGFALTPKKIEIELNYPLGGDPPRVDVLPLLTLFLGNEDLQCTFLNKFGPLPEVDALFREHSVAWGLAILDDLLQILLYTPHGTTTIVDLVFRDDAKHDIMGELRSRPFRPPPSMMEYLENLGYRDAWEQNGRVEFVVSKAAVDKPSGRQTGARKAFETQYRLMQH